MVPNVNCYVFYAAPVSVLSAFIEILDLHLESIVFCIVLHINLNPGTFCKPCVLFGCALGGGARVLLFVELFTVFVAGGCACVNILMLYGN